MRETGKFYLEKRIRAMGSVNSFVTSRPTGPAILRHASTVPEIDRNVFLARSAQHLLLLHGEMDFACTLDTQRYIQSLIPDSKLVVFEGAGHVPAMSRPMEVAAAINEYFTGRV
jgi:pimeloyl-ACP methyl ester carboxylesterase